MEKIKYVVDRIENGILVLVNDTDCSELQVPSGKFSEKLCENDIVYITYENGIIKEMTADKKETDLHKEAMKKKFSALFDN